MLVAPGGAAVLLRGWRPHLAQAALFHGSGFGAYELLTGALHQPLPAARRPRPRPLCQRFRDHAHASRPQA